MSKTVLIDADILTYRVGFSSQKTYYCVEDPETGFGYELASIKDAKEFGTEIVTRVDKMSEEFAANRLKDVLNTIQTGNKTDECKLYLTGKGNFRDEVAVSYPYKGNRKAAKPLHYQFLRDAMEHNYGAEIIEDMEADDALGIAQTDDTIIASIDKDLLMIPGEHYNINSGTKTVASDPGHLEIAVGGSTPKLVGVGFKWFCAQMLVGDATDNIKGIPRLGDMTAYKILNDIKHPMDMWEEVEYRYQQKDMIHRIEENALLLWIRRVDGQHPFDYIKEL
jgi:hypothetical protein